MRAVLAIIALLHGVSPVLSTAPAALLGPGFPPPFDLTGNHSLVPKAWCNFTATINSYVRKNSTLGGGVAADLGSYSFSVGAFSLYDDTAAQTMQYHHTGDDVKKSDIGDTKVTGDSIFRVESISKVFTVYLALIEIGSGYWDRPITDFVPYLAEYAKKTAPDPIHVVDWESVTLGTLAGHMAGIPRDSSLLNGDLIFSITPEAGASAPEILAGLGLPPLNISSAAALDACITEINATAVNCPPEQYLESLSQRPPIFSPWTTPIYTNAGYDLIELALENITGSNFKTMYQEDMFSPLKMKSTSLNVPVNLSHALIPGGKNTAAAAAYLLDGGISGGSGGIFSSTNDLAKFGLSILNSTLLSPAETRQWLKPITHTSSLELSVGRPWEIFRITQPLSGRVTDLYTKEGDGTGYSSYLILSPDHGVGFSILISGNMSTVYANTVVADTLTESLIPALEAQAAAEASRNLAGKYASNSPSLNSSLTLAVNQTYGTGLIVTSWISNGTNMISWLTKSSSAGDELSLFPTDLRSVPVGQTGQMAFRGTFGRSTYKRNVGIFTEQVTTGVVWEAVDSTSYGGVGLDLFVFDVDKHGKATAVSPAITRATLKKVA